MLIAVGLPAILTLAGMAKVVVIDNVPESPPWVASARYARTQNPFESDAASLAAGAQLYTAHCVACHGKSGTGDGIRSGELQPRPPDMSRPELWLQSDGELYYKTTKGRRPMPSYAKILSQEQAWHTINYLRTLSPKPKVLGARFDVGDTPRSAMARVLAGATTYTRAAADGNTEQTDAAARDISAACDALSAVFLTGQDKSVERLWKGAASRLSSRARALASATEGQARSAALSQFSMDLAGSLRLFGGSTSGRVYQFAAPLPGGTEGNRSWIQSDPTPRSPFQGGEQGQASLTAVFGPQTLRSD